MFGTEPINSEERSSRGFIKSRWKVLLSVVVFILFLWCADSYGLFEDEWQKERTGLVTAQADIAALSETYDSDSLFDVRSSFFWLPGGVVKDRLSINRIASRFDFGVDLIFIPGFREVQDNGVSQSTLPYGVTLFTKARLVESELMAWDISGFVGMEGVGAYTGLYPWGGRSHFELHFNPFAWGLRVGYSSDGVLNAETAFSLRFGRFLLMPAVQFKDSKFHIKFAGRFFFTPQVFLVTGVRNVPFYENTEGSLGLVWKKVLIFGTQADFEFVSTINQLLQVGVGFDFTFHIADSDKSHRETVPSWY